MRTDQPSRTARKIALNIVSLGATPGAADTLPAGMAHATARLLVASGAAGPALVRWSRSWQVVSLYHLFDPLMPGEFEGIGRRKVFCEQQLRDALQKGSTQVLVLGAGYDTLAWRLAPEFPGVRFFEIDHPATSRLKQKGIKAMGRPGNLHLMAEDLARTPLTKVMETEPSWAPNAQTAILAEGLLMYLPEKAVKALFTQCHDITGPESRMVFTYIGTGAGGRPDVGWLSGLLLWTMALAGEPWLWSLPPERLGAFLADTGWEASPCTPESPSGHGVEFYAVADKQKIKQERSPFSTRLPPTAR
ncbi:class I SAM-dependent methyltransferase [Desulfoluna butyratoxydans]|uniref:S-adenosyl-L-methionine-dependent methyltransferase n=1 Tax=Desulfoluna butyratoxydans TaxID=231438 RepID=A0A4U8YRX4_9BACT|nr:SAM-dependent methyltransferase [Desulfoluna butyratoxydans]VFQ47086.1 s-adenosyl-l-methionine-dependent methyltransferase [Desulfoluna butyratoxydans]